MNTHISSVPTWPLYPLLPMLAAGCCSHLLPKFKEDPHVMRYPGSSCYPLVGGGGGGGRELTLLNASNKPGHVIAIAHFHLI